MEDVVGILVNDKKRGQVAFLTLGRTFDRVDSKSLVRALKVGLHKFGIGAEASITVCESLREVASAEYFYEGLLALAQKRIPYGKRSYPVWKRKMKLEISAGKEIYLIGKVSRKKNKRQSSKDKRGNLLR
jgi:hypothetical protein